MRERSGEVLVLSAPAAAPVRRIHPALLFAGIFVALLLTHLPLLSLPYFWDEAGHYVPYARDLMLRGDVIPVSTISNAHPPVVPAYLALVWKLTTYSPTMTRVAMLLWAALGLLGIYKLAEHVSNRHVAWAAALLCGLYPVYFAQSTMAHIDLPTAALCFWGIYFYLRRRVWLCCAMFALAALTKETAILTPLALFAWECVQRVFGLRWQVLRSDDTARPLWPLLLPVLPLVLWFGYHYVRTGYLFGNPEFFSYNVAGTLHPLRILLALFRRTWQALGYMNLFVLTAAMLLAMRLPAIEDDGVTRRRIAIPTQLGFAAVILAHVMALSVIGGAVLARYMLTAVPLVTIISVSTLWRRVAWWREAVAVVALGFVLGLFINPPYTFSPEDNLAYRDFVQLQQQGTAVLAERHERERVLTAWPATDALTKPYLGYVPRAIPVVPVRDFSIGSIFEPARDNSLYDAVFVFSTKYRPETNIVEYFPWYERMTEKYFDHHRDLPPEVIAGLVGGRIEWQRSQRGWWAAVIVIERPQDAGIRSRESGVSGY